MAASEKDCECEDCDCDKKEMKKREKFYIQKIQELRKQMVFRKDIPMANTQNQAPNTGILNFTPEQQKAAEENLRNTTPNMGANLARDMRANYDRKQKGGTINQAPQGGSPKDLIDTKIPTKTLIEENTSKPANIYNEKGKLTTKLEKDPTPEQFYKLNPNLKPEPPAPAAEAAAETAPAPTEKAPEKTTYDIKNPFKVENAKNFKDAFNQARTNIGAGGVFEYGGKKYHTYTQDEFKNPQKSGVPTDNKFYKDWQARKDTTGPNAYYANKANPTAAGQPTGESAAQSTAAPAAKTPNPNANVTGINQDGSISSIESDGSKTVTMPKNPITTARPDQMGFLERKYADPGMVAARVPIQSAKSPNNPTKPGDDTATTTYPTSQKMEGNLDTHKMEGNTRKRLNYNQA